MSSLLAAIAPGVTAGPLEAAGMEDPLIGGEAIGVL